MNAKKKKLLEIRIMSTRQRQFAALLIIIIFSNIYSCLSIPTSSEEPEPVGPPKVIYVSRSTDVIHAGNKEWVTLKADVTVPSGSSNLTYSWSWKNSKDGAYASGSFISNTNMSEVLWQVTNLELDDKAYGIVDFIVTVSNGYGSDTGTTFVKVYP